MAGRQPGSGNARAQIEPNRWDSGIQLNGGIAPERAELAPWPLSARAGDAHVGSINAAFPFEAFGMDPNVPGGTVQPTETLGWGDDARFAFERRHVGFVIRYRHARCSAIFGGVGRRLGLRKANSRRDFPHKGQAEEEEPNPF